MKTDVVIVGGGLAGLTCAALLGRSGHDVVVLERAAALGGLGRTRIREGFAFNRGAHALLRGGAAASVLDMLGISLRGAAPSVRGVAFDERGRHRLPSTAAAMIGTRMLTLGGRWQLMRRFATIGSVHGGEESAADWVQHAVSDPVARAFLSAMLRLSTYCGDLRSIRAREAVAALRQATVHGVLYLDDGWQQLVDALAQRCVDAGVQLRTGAAVEHVEARAVTLRDGSIVEASHVVLAVPPSVAGQWVAVSPLQHARVACLDVALSERPKGPGLAFDISDPMYLSVHSDAARLAGRDAARLAGDLQRSSGGRGALVHTLHYGAPDDARVRLEGLLDRSLPGWRRHVVHTQFLPSITVTEGVVPPGATGRPGVRAADLWRIGDAVGAHGALADAALGSAREVACAILEHAPSRAA